MKLLRRIWHVFVCRSNPGVRVVYTSGNTAEIFCKKCGKHLETL